MRRVCEAPGAGKLSRRIALLSGGAALAGCASPTPDDCNPANAGIGRYVRCRTEYVERQNTLVVRARRGEARNARSRARINELQAENNRLRRRLDALNREIDALDKRRTALLRTAANLPSLSEAQGAYLRAVARYLDDILAMQNEGLALDPPLDLLPADAPERRAYLEARRELHAARTEARDIRDVVVELAVDGVVGAAAERLFNFAARRALGAAWFARFVHPVTRVVFLGISVVGAAITIFGRPD